MGMAGIVSHNGVILPRARPAESRHGADRDRFGVSSGPQAPVAICKPAAPHRLRSPMEELEKTVGCSKTRAAGSGYLGVKPPPIPLGQVTPAPSRYVMLRRKSAGSAVSPSGPRHVRPLCTLTFMGIGYRWASPREAGSLAGTLSWSKLICVLQ